MICSQTPDYEDLSIVAAVRDPQTSKTQWHCNSFQIPEIIVLCRDTKLHPEMHCGNHARFAFATSIKERQ